MKRENGRGLRRALLSGLLAASLVTGGFPALAEELPQAAESATSEETQAGETRPVLPTPEETEPAEREPTELEETEPGETEPEETQPAEPEETQPEETDPQETGPEPSPQSQEAAGPGLYFGQLHAHTAASGVPDTAAEAFSQAAQAMDFFALTESSQRFDDAAWTEGRAAAASATTASFAALYGYEMSWARQLRIGHIGVFGADSFRSASQPDYSSYETGLTRFYQTLAGEDGAVGQFNHPGSQYGTFFDYEYDPQADGVMTLMEIEPGSLSASSPYILALDKGWHLAPTCNQGVSARTAVYAQALTEEGLVAAMGQRRVYATEDADLALSFTIDGQPMGSRLVQQELGKELTVCVTASDPTDGPAGLVEVIGCQGRILAAASLEAGSIQLSLPPEEGYYLIRLTQPDGDCAVTAPIWIEAGAEALGLGTLTCQTREPVRLEPLALTLELYNRENRDFLVDELTIFADGVPVHQCQLEQIGAKEALSLPISLCLDSIGATTLQAVLTGTLEGSPRRFEASLALFLRQSPLADAIVVDASHGNQGLDELTMLEALAREAGRGLRICRESLTADDLKEAELVLITAPEGAFSQEFLALMGDFAQWGGCLAVCGQAAQEDAFSSADQLNRLLEAVGATLRINADAALDTVNNGGRDDLLYTDLLNLDAPWDFGLTRDQTFRVAHSATVSPGDGIWLAMGYDTTSAPEGQLPVLLAAEPLSGGGTVFAAGCLFLSDEALALPASLRANPTANRTVALGLLGMAEASLPLLTIREARGEAAEELVRIRGYVTAGTSNPYNTFSQGIYVQDETGGILAGPLPEDSLQQGTAVELTGTVTDLAGSRFLRIYTLEALELPARLPEPLTESWPILLAENDLEGTLVQVEGTCVEIYCREDDRLAGCLLEDAQGNQIALLVEPEIGNGSDGENNLLNFVRKGRTIRAIGLLYADENGERVIRVRNCEEVVYVPPRRLPSLNPDTGDPGPAWGAAGVTLCPLALHALGKGRRKRRQGN